MDEKELKEAAEAAAQLTGADRIEFVMKSYPNAKYQWGDIFNLADRIRKNDNSFICKYNGIGKTI